MMLFIPFNNEKPNEIYCPYHEECKRKIEHRLKIRRVMLISKISVNTFCTYFIALKKYLKEVRRPPGRPNLTWVKLVINNLQKYSNLNLNYVSENSTFNDLFILCADRQTWRSRVL